jgi:hypothetical protein
MLKWSMKTRRNSNVVCASIHVSNTVLSEPTLSVFMMKSNHINAAFVKNDLVLKEIFRDKLKLFTKNNKK